MALLRGSFQNQGDSNHLITSNSQGLVYAGLGSFNTSALDQLAKTKFHQLQLKTGLEREGHSAPQSYDLPSIITAVGGDTSFKYTPFDDDAKKYGSEQTIPATELIDLARWYEETYLPNKDSFGDDVPSQLNTIFAIQTSSEKCARSVSGEVVFEFHFCDPQTLSRDRQVVSAGPPTFAAVPRTHAGTPYSPKATKTAGTGNYKQSKKGDANDPSDKVVAPLKTMYDQNTGMHDIQNTIIAILLEDLDPARIPTEEVTESDADNLSADTVYDGNSTSYQGDFTTALAMPLSIENGNPNSFGPNMIDCDGTIKPEKIRVVNRGPKRYFKGNRVICHYSGGEWFGTDWSENPDIEPKPTQLSNRWQFSKFLASSSTYFMTADGKQIINPHDVEESARYAYYPTGNPNAIDPPYMIDIRLSTAIMQSSIFDQLAQDAIYRNTNLSLNPDAETYRDYNLFWGPVFSDGVRKSFPGEGDIVETVSPDYEIKTAVGEAAKDISASAFDRRHIPAEVAACDKESPIESYGKIAAGFNSNNYTFLSEGSHYNYREFSNGVSNAMLPVNPGKIQFTALTDTFACCDDLSTIDDPESDRRFRQNMLEYAGKIKPPLAEPDMPAEGVGLGAALERGFPQVGQGAGYKTAPYDQYNDPPIIKRTSHKRRSAIAPRGEGDSNGDGFELVGIISAKNTVTRSGGGSINFTVGERFGAFSPQTSSSQNAVASIIGGIVFAMSQGSIKLNNRNPAWGTGSANSFPPIYEFGTTALWVKVYDSHPTNQTVFIGPYFAVLHFNPGKSGSSASVESITYPMKEYTLPKSKQKIQRPDFSRKATSEDESTTQQVVHQADTSVDTRVPTDDDGNELSVGTTLGPDSLIRPDSHWNVDTSRRGAMLTGGYFLDTDGSTPRGGYIHTEKHIGAGKISVKKQGNETLTGAGFVAGEVYDGPKGSKLTFTVNNRGGITGISFKETSDGNVGLAGKIQEERGSGFRPEDLGENGYEFRVSPGGQGTSAILIVEDLQVYEKFGAIDYAPRFYGMKAVSSGPNETEGTNLIRGGKTTEFSVNANETNQYDVFYHFYNDITHTSTNATDVSIVDQVQHITVSIT